MKVFLSYSSKDSQYASELDSACMLCGVHVIRDDRELKPYDNIISFMDNIKTNDFAIMLISENYLKSKYCLYEFTEFMKKDNFHKKVLPIMLPNFLISNEIYKSVNSYFKSPSYSKLNDSKTLYLFGSKPETNPLSVQFDTIWKYLSETKLLSFKNLKDSEYKDLFSYIGIYDKDIWNSVGQIFEIKDQEDQEIAFAKLKKDHPGSYIVFYQLATLNKENKKYKNAIFYYNDFIDKFKDETFQLMGLYGIGTCYFKLKEYDTSIEFHQKALDLSSFNLWWHSYKGLGDAYLIGKNMPLEAKDCYEKANKVVKEYQVCKNLAVIELVYKNYSKAISYLKEAIDIKPDDSDLWFLLKHCYINNGEIEKANKIVIQAYQKFPNSYRIITDYANLLYLDLDVNTLLHIEKILIKSFKLNSNYILTRILYANTLIFLNKKARNIDFAIRILEKTLQILGEEQTLQILGEEQTLQILGEEEKETYKRMCLNLLKMVPFLKKIHS